MTRDKLKKSIVLGMRHAYSRGSGDPESVSEYVADAIELALELEMDSQTQDDISPPPTQQSIDDSAAIDFPIVDMVSKGDLAQGSPQLPTSPSVDMRAQEQEQPKLILTPREAREEVAQVAQPAADNTIVSAPDLEPWEVEALIAEMERATPGSIDIEVDVPERGPVPIHLERNIMAGHGFGAVKVSYKHEAASDDLAVFETIMLDDVEVDVTAMMDKLKSSAQHAYRPRKKGVTSSTPLRTGVMSFDLNETPHDQTDVLTNQAGDKY
jgi:hypothetical protein